MSLTMRSCASTSHVAPMRTCFRRSSHVRCNANTGQHQQQLAHLQMLMLAASTISLTAGPALADTAMTVQPQAVDNGWLNPIVDSLNAVLGSIEGLYESVGLPDAYGWSIVSLTAVVKLLVLPLTKKQVESSMAVQELKPRIDAIKERYSKDKKKQQKETSNLYQEAQVNPLAGCLPSVLQLPIYLGLFRSLNNVAKSGTLDQEGFLFIPSLAGPVAESYATGGGGSVSWFFPFVDGAPPVGWENAWPYLILPVVLIASQYVSTAVLTPVDPNAEGAATQKALFYILPLTLSWISLTVPSGLTLYYVANSVFTTLIQVYFRKLGGAKVESVDLGPVKKLGMGRRSGPVVTPLKAAAALPANEFGGDALAAEFGGSMATNSSANGASSGAAQGADMMQAMADMQGSANDAASSAAANGAESNGTAAANGALQGGEAEQAIVGGFELDKSLMDGVAKEELAFLERRCKRRRRQGEPAAA